VLVFPLTGLTLLRRAMAAEGRTPPPEPPAHEAAPQAAM
jgi:hypothetical protein